MPSLTLSIKHGTDLHKRLVGRLRSRILFSEKIHNERHEKWQQAEERALAFIPEQSADALRRARRENLGIQSYTTIQLPYSYALLMSAHTYLTSVFFSRDPIHQVSGRHGETEMQTQAMEALLDYQVVVGEMLAPYYIWLYDALKYGCGVLGNYWCDEITSYSTIQAQQNAEGEVEKLYVRGELPGYSGNKVYNVSPFNCLPDPRVPFGRFQDGEYFAVRIKIPWSQVLQRARRGYYMNVDKIAKTEQLTGDDQWGSPQLKRPEDFSDLIDDWGLGPEGNVEAPHPAVVQIYEIYVDLVPDEWGLGESKMSEKWVFTLTNQKDLLIGATPLGAMHGKFPFDVLEVEPEAYGMWNRGIPEIMEPIQQTMDWLLNTHFYNVRASLNNQFIIDPSKIVLRDAEKGGPGFIYRLRPEAYGEDIRKFFMQVPVSDVTQVHMNDLNAMFGIGERVLGINDQIMGMLQGGGRKTATEIRTSTSFGTNRMKTIAEWFSASGFALHSRKLIQNTQQFYNQEKKFKIVGELATEAGPRFMTVTPDMITGFYDFVPVDGALPVDRFAQANLWKEIILGLGRNPQLSMQFDLARIFAWMAQLAGVKNVNQFKVQVMPDQALAQQAQMGNVVPMGGAGQPGGRASVMAGLPQMMQQPQV